MRRLLATVVLAAIVACGGDATGVKNPTFPAVAGVYAIDGSFSGAVPFTGTISFSQASREQPALTGTANITVTLDTEVLTFTTISNASVSENGLIGFNIGESDGSSSWRFQGTLSSGTKTGTHTITDGTDSVSGTFTATKQ